jgi:hypothetical protein
MEIGTLFFHQAITKRRRRNTIVYVKDENDIVQFMPDKISNTFVNYFSTSLLPKILAMAGHSCTLSYLFLAMTTPIQYRGNKNYGRH